MPDRPGERAVARRHDLLLALAPLIAVAGFLSYFGFFVRWPFLRDTGLLNLALLLLAVALSGLALRRVWTSGWLRRAAGLAGVLVSTGLTGLFVAYCYFISYGLPPADDAVQVGEAVPPIALTSWDDTRVDLGRASQQPLVLVFYRGFW